MPAVTLEVLFYVYCVLPVVSTLYYQTWLKKCLLLAQRWLVLLVITLVVVV